jgi:cellulose synthase/poly-beta-1,6-N-acetylglucosamine synthase-like glycosyltransferase
VPSALLTRALVAFEIVVLGYFLALNSLYLLFSIVAYVRLRQHRRRWTARELGAVMRSPATPAISIIVPAYNEAATIAESIRSLLLLNYPEFELIVVNDGSTDRTLEVAVSAYGLVEAPLACAQAIPTRPVRGVWRSITRRDLVVIDKANGGKADAINAGINAARYPLVCVIDADSLLEEHALTRAVLPFIETPATVAAGGIVRIANGCRVDRGRVTEVRAPRHPLARFQVVEYLRAFLAGRVAQSWVNGLLIISGAFGLFRRDVVVAAGGFCRETVGEDMELVVRLHRACREQGRPYRIVFQPDPVCWTEAPEQTAALARQRNRWQRGTLQVLARHRGMIFNPRHGVVGLVSMPYYLVFEGFGPLVEVAGYVVTLVALPLGLLDWRFAELLFLAAVAYGTLISLTAVVLEELSFRRYLRVADLLTLVLYGFLENFGYRQLTSWWRVQGIVDFLRRRQTWGAMPRRGFQEA